MDFICWFLKRLQFTVTVTGILPAALEILGQMGSVEAFSQEVGCRV